MPLKAPTNASSPVLSQFSLSGKVAAVTGGSRGIGLEVVQGLAEAGADVAIIYSSPSSAGLAAEAITQITAANKVKLLAYQSDVRDQNVIAATLNQVVADFGKLDICVANAGVASHYDSLEYTRDQWRDIMSTNLDGAMYTAQAAGRIFKAQGYGNLIFTASVSGTLVNIPQRQSAYNASKAAVVHLAKSLAVEWVDFNARVNCISPGFIATDMLSVHPEGWRKQWFEMIPGRRLCDPAELKSAYVFLASDACTYMTGAEIIIDGGYTLP